MHATALTTKAEISRAVSELAASLRRKGVKLRRTLGWQGGHREVTLYWHSDYKLWSAIQSFQTEHWCNFGMTDPGRIQNLSSDWQLTTPASGQNRRYAGAFVRDENNRLYAAHSGKVGGGRKGIGKSAFLRYLGGSNLEIVRWPDGSETKMILVAELGSRHLLEQLVDFTHKVKAFKLAAANSRELKVSSFRARMPNEFSGQKVYKQSGVVTSRCDHGLVIDALGAAMRRRGFRVGYDQARDLYALRDRGGLKFLFEAKTDLSPSSLYQAVGQLLINGRYAPGQPKLILVLPAQPKDAVAEVLARLGIRTVIWTMRTGAPKFRNLDSALAS